MKFDKIIDNFNGCYNDTNVIKIRIINKLK